MKITLAAIVGNEEAVTERFIRSFAPAVDSFVFVTATGSQAKDETIAIAFKVCEEIGKNIRVSSYQNKADLPFVDNFGEARQAAWNIAASRNPDFIMWADADDILAEGAAEAIRKAAESASHDVFIMPYHVRGNKQVVHRERMVKANVGSYWKHAIHEQLAFPRDVSYRVIKDAVFIHAPLSEKTGSHERNIAILERELEDAPRNLFYLAQQHFQNGDDAKFQKYAKSALTFPELGKIERYETLLNLAQTKGQDSRKLAAEAFALMPDRREALALLCNYSIIDGDFETALVLAKKLVETDRPNKTYWSQNNEWYGWKGAELYRQCLRLTGDTAEADLEFELNRDDSRPIISIVHATLDRPEKALAIRELWLSRAICPENVEYVFGLHSFDKKSVNVLKGFKHTITDEKGAAINYDTAAGATTGQIIVQAQDDCYPPEGWDDALLKIIGDCSKPVFVATNDGHRTDLISVNTIMTRAYMEIKAARDPGENGFFHRGYTTVFPDTENSFRALQDHEAGICQHIVASNFVIYHDHPFFNPGIPMDATYQWENSPENYIKGQEVFMRRNPGIKEDSFVIKPQLEEVLV